MQNHLVKSYTEELKPNSRWVTHELVLDEPYMKPHLYILNLQYHYPKHQHPICKTSSVRHTSTISLTVHNLSLARSSFAPPLTALNRQPGNVPVPLSTN